MAKKYTSRPARWAKAVADARAAHGDMTEAAAKLNTALDDLRSLKEEYEEWKDNLPENVQSSSLGEKLEEVSNLDLDWEPESGSADDAEGIIDNAEGIDLPRGFGRD